MSTISHVLVVDDEPSICWGFEQLLGEQGHVVVTASSVEEGLEKAKLHDYALVLLDVRLPGEDGISALPKFRQATDDAPIVIVTAFGDLETAVGAVQNGATDYLTKPFRLDDAAKICRQAMRNRPSPSDTPSPSNHPNDVSVLLGKSSAMQQVFRQIALVADSDLCVLITGESGTGKELVAAAIHRHSRRCDQAYLAVTPVGASEPAIQREWFGDLNHDQKGAFELAHGGTLLLDEIGDLPRSLQVKLLRVLEQQAFTQVGAVKPSRCDVRCIASTKRDLHQAVNQGEFGEDLLYRLSAVSIHLPPLRGRLEDIPMLCEFFLRRLGYPSPSNAIDDKTMQHLQSRKWWGNVRELRNAVDHASVIARGRPLEIADFPPPQSGNSPTSHSGNASPLAVIEQWTQSQLENSNDKVTDLHEKFLAAVEPALLKVVLQHTDGNRAAAAELLGIHRGTLRERLKRYGID